MSSDQLQRDLDSLLTSLNKDDSDSPIQDKLFELNQAKLGNTFYAKELKKILKNIKNEKLLFNIKSKLPNTTILSWDDFYKTLEKYDLAVDFLDNYEKIIPDQNIEDLIKASKIIDNDEIFREKETCGGGLEFIKTITINSDGIIKKKSELKKIIDFIGRLPIFDLIIGRLPIEIECEKYKLIRKYQETTCCFDVGYKINNNWLIAAPIKEMENNVTIRIDKMIKFSKSSKSNIHNFLIFRAMRFGVIIVTYGGAINLKKLI